MHWLDRYSNNYHAWHTATTKHGTAYYRRLGIIESLFDLDGAEFGGRADLNLFVELNVKHRLTPETLRHRINLAWAILRQQFLFLQAKALDAGKSAYTDGSGLDAKERVYVFRPPTSLEEATADAYNSCDFVEDHYPSIDVGDFRTHAANTDRVFDACQNLSRLFVFDLPKPSSKPGETHELRFLLVVAHSIADGLTSFAFSTRFTNLLNRSFDELKEMLSDLIIPASIHSRLPPAQEDYYPAIPGNLARQRWFWAISRILRHIGRNIAPASITNPLSRTNKLVKAKLMQPKYPKLLNYDPAKTPPLNSFREKVDLSKPATARVQSLCRDIGVSIGSGCFALVALTMMLLHERLDPDHDASSPTSQPGLHRPLVLSFPINARPFTTYSGPANSLMLAFSPGIVLPFLPSHLPLEPRFKLIALQADRQLRRFQKSARGSRAQAAMGSASAAQLIPALYTASIDGFRRSVKPAAQRGVNPQGAYPAREAPTLATCGVSSIGLRTPLVKDARFDLAEFERGDKDLVADFDEMEAFVRVRDGEFLVGSQSDGERLRFTVSYDGNALDEAKVGLWKEVICGMMEQGVGARL